MNFLEIKNVSKGFPIAGGIRSVLKDVNFAIREGEFVSMVGYSGSGKTTLVSMIAGLLKPDSGEILLEGKPVREPGPDRGIIFQNYSLLPWLTVFENVYLAVEAVTPGMNKPERTERTEHFIRMVKLDQAMKKFPKELSGGMRQRVAVARCLAMTPRLMLLDEPFSALDALTRADLQDELSRIWEEERRTVVMITNDVDEAILLADRIFAFTPGPDATVGLEITVDIPRPRIRRQLSLQPEYQRVRKEIVEYLLHHRQQKSAATANPVNKEHKALIPISPRLQGSEA